MIIYVRCIFLIISALWYFGLKNGWSSLSSFQNSIIIITIKQCHHHKPSPRGLQKKESRKFKCPAQSYHQYIIIQVHQDEEAEVELSNFEPLEVPPSQTGLNVTGVQVSSSFPGFRGNFSSLDITLVIQVDLQYYVGAISGQHSGAYVFRFGLFEAFSIFFGALQRHGLGCLIFSQYFWGKFQS